MDAQPTPPGSRLSACAKTVLRFGNHDPRDGKEKAIRRKPLIRVLLILRAAKTPPWAILSTNTERGCRMSRICKLPWADKFHAPTLSQLKAHYNKEKCALFEATRERLLAIEGIREEIAWQGVPWRWSLVYTLDGDESASTFKAWAYLIPDPERLQLCLTLTADQIHGIGVKRLKKWVRDGVVFARSVGGVCWPTFEISQKGQIEDVFELVDRKLKVQDAATAERIEA